MLKKAALLQLRLSILALIGANLAYSCPACADYELDVSKVVVIEPYRDFDASDMAKLVPTNMQASEDSLAVGRQIADFALQNWMRSPTLRNTHVGRSAEQIQRQLQRDVSIGKSSDGKIEHKVAFQFQPIQSQTLIKYSCYLNANLSYKAANAEWNVEVSQNLASSTDLVYTRVARVDESIDNVSVRWTF